MGVLFYPETQGMLTVCKRCGTDDRDASGHCRLCVYKNAQKYRKNNPRKVVAASKKWKSNNALQARLHGLRHNAKRRGIPFNLTLEDLVGTVCPVFGTPLDWSAKRTENSAEVDRIIPSMGYVKGNVRVVSRKANRLKSDGTLTDFKMLVRYLERV